MKAYHRRRRERNAYALRPRQPNTQALDRDRRRRPAAPTPWQGRMRALQDELHRNDPHANSMQRAFQCLGERCGNAGVIWRIIAATRRARLG
jgi:hypothetical protein